MRQVRIYLETDKSIIAIASVINSPEFIGHLLNVSPAQCFIDRNRSAPVESHVSDVLVIEIAACDCILEDRGIRGHPCDCIFIDHSTKLTVCDQVAASVIDPNR